jgi:hypothetical protein
MSEIEDVVEYHADGTRTVRIQPKREWVGLTGEDIEKILLSGKPWCMTEYHIYSLIEAKLKEKNT